MTKPFIVEIKGMKKLKAAFRRSPMIASKEIQRAIATSVMLVNRNAKLETPVRTGTLRRGIKSKISPFKGTIESTVAYGVYVHEGTGPHIIRPVNKKALFWKGAKHPVKVVHHPGTKANPFMKRATEKSRGGVQRIFQKAINRIINNLKI